MQYRLYYVFFIKNNIIFSSLNIGLCNFVKYELVIFDMNRMMIRALLCIVFSAICSSCFKPSVSINVLCENDARSNYILKWEIFPEPDESATIDIFTSYYDTTFPSYPGKTVKADDFIAVIDNKPDSLRRMFFKVKFGKSSSGIISNRLFLMDSIQNFRDMGGYLTSSQKQVRWGMLYRSGTFSYLSDKDRSKLKNLNIKTVLDLRTKDSKSEFPEKNHVVKNYVRIPIGVNGYESISKKILEDRFLRGDAIIFTQDIYRSFVENYSKEYAAFFNYLCNKDNYPIAFNCLLGKDQSGLAAYLLLYILGVPPETAEEDYMFSNEGIKRLMFFKDAGNMSESKQEAMTMISNVDLSNLRYALSCVRKKYGSVDYYIENELGMTHRKCELLRSILLY